MLIPSIQPLLQDPESVIRQHVAAQLLPLAVVCMIEPQPGRTVQDWIDDPSLDQNNRPYNPAGYKLVVTTVVDYLCQFLQDPELDVRRAAADALTGVSLQIQPADVPQYCLPTPLQLALEKPKANPAAAAAPNSNNSTNTNPANPTKQKRTEEEQRQEELRISAANLLAEMGGSASEHRALQGAVHGWVRQTVLPAILELAADPSFRIRRCAAQAMPRLLGACCCREGAGADAVDEVLSAFDQLSRDDVHRVRKAVGECLVDMSRALVILADGADSDRDREALYQKRRAALLPIAERLIQDPHKMVRQGMMQFLGPFMASFYPFQYSPLHALLPRNSESDGSNHVGIVSQFFPHASSMVSRLNSAQNATQTAPTPVHARLEELTPNQIGDLDKLQRALPPFVHAARMSTWSLAAVTTHRQQHPPSGADLDAVVESLLDYFVALAAVQTGDENTDAEMRVYCAYSFPAVVLLLGPEHWEGAVQTCFHTLLNPRYPEEPDATNGEEDDDEDNEPPLPVKRCLASSLHTVAHILGSEIAVQDIMGVVQKNFLADVDDSVRLSTIRNFPELLKLVPANQRKEPIALWSEVVMSEDMLGGNKRSATNPVVLNWRQRDYLARSLPDLLLLVEPSLIQKHLWPVLKMLLEDPINVVREDALWSFPILLKTFCPYTLSGWATVRDKAKKYSSEMCLEVISWLQESVLCIGSRTKLANFNDRQLYCRICAAVGLALRFGDIDLVSEAKDPVSVLSDKFKSFFFAEKRSDATENGPYQRLSSAEIRHLKHLLMEELLPAALEMKEDRISNVRITLMKSLQVMPTDIRTSTLVKPVLKDLVDEMETWTSFGAEEPSLMEQQEQFQKQTREAAEGKNDGPVDVDAIIPDAADDSSGESGAGGGVGGGAPSGSEQEEKPKPAKAKSKSPTRPAREERKESDKNSDGEESISSSQKPHKKYNKEDLKKVTFEDGSIGSELSDDFLHAITIERHVSHTHLLFDLISFQCNLNRRQTTRGVVFVAFSRAPMGPRLRQRRRAKLRSVMSL